MGTFTTSIVVAAVLLAAVGGIATVAYIESANEACYRSLHDPGESSTSATAGGECAPSPCPEGPPTDHAEDGESKEGLIRFQVESAKRTIEARLCVLHPEIGKIYDETVTIRGGDTAWIDAAVTSGSHLAVFHAQGEQLVAEYRQLDIADCTDHALLIESRIHVGFNSFNERSQPPRCFAPGNEAGSPDIHMQGAMGMDPNAPAPPAIPVTVLLAGAAAITLAALAFTFALRNDGLKWLLAVFFTRISGSKALDHSVRRRVHDLIAAEPGVQREEVRTGLGLSHSQTAHHLDVLQRTGLIEITRIDGTRHYFEAGRYPSDERRRVSLLRNDAARRLYEAVQQCKRTDMATVGKITGYSRSYVSRMAGRLCAEGLLIRRRNGRRVILQVPQDTIGSE